MSVCPSVRLSVCPSVRPIPIEIRSFAPRFTKFSGKVDVGPGQVMAFIWLKSVQNY